MNAQVITIRPLLRPTFDNTNLGKFALWVNDNSNTLARYWRDQGIAIGVSADDDEEFTFWLRVQHDIEVAAQRNARLPHGSCSL